MQKRTREIIALVFLLVLGVGLIAGAAWYLRIGHNWTLAATVVDDIVGSMDRYMVVLYEGTAPTADSAPAAIGAQSRPLTPREQALMAKGSALAEEVAASYRGKGAATIELNPNDLDRYSDSFCVPRAGKRIGIVRGTGPTAYLHAWRQAAELREKGATTVIAIIDHPTETPRGISGVDVAVLIDDESLPGSGKRMGDTFVVGNPEVGTVQAVLIPQSGVISAKVIDAL